MREKVCIIGDGITALMLTKALLDLDIKIDLITKNNFKTKIQDNRTIGISDSNLFFLKNQGIIDKKTKIFWKINQIKIFNSKLKLNKNLLLNFENKEKNSIFHMVKNDAIHLSLKKKNTKKFITYYHKKE